MVTSAATEWKELGMLWINGRRVKEERTPWWAWVATGWLAWIGVVVYGVFVVALLFAACGSLASIAGLLP